MFYRFPLALLALGAMVGCEPAGQKEEPLDERAIFDHRVVRDEGWTVEGEKSNKFDGLQLSTVPSLKTDGSTKQEINLQNASMNKSIPELNGQETGTARMKFSIPKIPKTGFRFDVSFATGAGLPVELTVTNSGIKAKCGYIATPEGTDMPVKAVRDYELRIIRKTNSALVSLALVEADEGKNTSALIPSLNCEATQNADNAPRSAGWLKITLFAQQPEEQKGRLSLLDFAQYESTLLMKRIRVYKDMLTD